MFDRIVGCVSGFLKLIDDAEDQFDLVCDGCIVCQLVGIENTDIEKIDWSTIYKHATVGHEGPVNDTGDPTDLVTCCSS